MSSLGSLNIQLSLDTDQLFQKQSQFQRQAQQKPKILLPNLGKCY